MFEIIKVYKENFPKQKFIGKKYDNANRVNGTFSVKEKWNECFKEDWFKLIENNIENMSVTKTGDSDAYIGLLRNKPKEPFQYWIGMFTPQNTVVPNGFDFIDFPESELGVCRVCGKEEDILFYEGIEILDICNKKLQQEGMNHAHDKDDVCWAFERYSNTRSKIKDKEGNIIVDICFFV